MRRAILVGAALAGLSLTGCHPVDRLLGIDRGSQSFNAPAVTPPSPAPPSNAPALERYETYRFLGTVKSDGSSYYGTVAPGDQVTGTFKVDFEQPATFSSSGFEVYQALASIEGSVGGYPFSGTQNLIYVKPASATAYFVDTGYMTLDGNNISFDYFFQLATDRFSDGNLANLRSLDQRTYANVDLFFETDPRNGLGFNAQITSLQRLDAPLTLASARPSK